MRIGVAIATVDREVALRSLCSALCDQSQPPVAIAICAPAAGGIPDDIAHLPMVVTCTGIRGASAQRNAAVAALPDDIDAIAFFDDDAIPRMDYLERASSILSQYPDVIGVTGHLVCDGSSEGREISDAEMAAALEESWSHRRVQLTSTRRLYGNNMVVRAKAARATQFDERLPLYSWLEDLDFSRRLLQRGRLIAASDVIAAHQGSASGGRKQHRRLGYSQVANVAHLFRKGSITPSEALLLAGRPIAGSLRGALAGPDRAGRRQRLGGMALAAGDLARKKITPERITSL